MVEQLQEDRRAWTPVTGERLVLVPHSFTTATVHLLWLHVVILSQDNNKHDKHTVTVMKDGCIVGHVPRPVSQVSGFFSKHGHITCCVAGNGAQSLSRSSMYR